MLPYANVAALLLIVVSVLRNSMVAFVPWFTLFCIGRIITWGLRQIDWLTAYWWAEMILLPLRAAVCIEALGLLTETHEVTRRERFWIACFGLSIGAFACLPVLEYLWPADPSRAHLADAVRHGLNVVCAGFMAGVLFYTKIGRYFPSRHFATEHALLLLCYFILIAALSSIRVMTYPDWVAVDIATQSGTLAMFALWFAVLRPRRNLD